MGRPSDYTPETAAAICERLSAGENLRAICASDDMPPESTVRTWALDDREGFSAQYTRARMLGYLSMADELLEVSDNASNDWMERRAEEGAADAGWEANGDHMQRSRLRVDTRKWILSKALPKIFGDKLDMNLGGQDGNPVTIRSERVIVDPANPDS
jgi:hypothetical protein